MAGRGRGRGGKRGGSAKPPKPYDRQRSWNYVLWLLSRRAYTRAELADKLRGKGAEPEVIDGVIERLEELRFVDDQAYAEGYVRSRAPRKGRIALRRELFRKGVEEEEVDAALRPLDDEQQAEAAAAVLAKNAWRFRKGDERRDRARAFAFLARRGFAGNAVSGALEGFFAEGEDEEDGEGDGG